MDRDAIVFWSCMALGACSAYPYVEPRPQEDVCADFARNEAWIREQGAPLNVGNEVALAKLEADARRAGCR